MSNQRNHQQWVPSVPSPLANVQFSRPLSHGPHLVVDRDSKFWKRFSAAVHLAEERCPADVESGNAGSDGSLRSVGTFDIKDDNDWLAQQKKEKRRCRNNAIFIALGILFLLASGIITGIWLVKRYRN